jgi:uncharacterized protein
MLPLQLLRVRITNKGKNISPVFCKHNDVKDTTFDELRLAADMIEQFEESFRKKETKGSLAERIELLESQSDDYKLVRGLYTLLERRCKFSNGGKATLGPIKTSVTPITISRKINEVTNNKTNSDGSRGDNDVIGNKYVKTIDPVFVRKCLFEESSKRGYALTDFERKEIIVTVASRIDLSTDKIIKDMWADLEENMILEAFDPIGPEKLISWYNLSLMQTLLFNCTKLEFHVCGGSNWKRALRDVKRLGLMYNLQYQQKEDLQQGQRKKNELCQNDDDEDNYLHIRSPAHAHIGHDNSNIIICSIDGPLSIFKLTDRYGTSIAKLLPSIVSSEGWSIKALIVRKTATVGKKIYEFEMSKVESPHFLSEPNQYGSHDNSKKSLEEEGEGEKVSSFFRSFSYDDNSFDSNVEEKFATKFEQSSNGWKLIREPEPLIVSTGKGFIPDFAFEKYGRRVYLEIVGFWTNEYLVKKIQKIADIMSSSPTPPSSVSSTSRLAQGHNINKMDFFIAINIDSYVSENSLHKERILARLRLSDYIDKDHLIVYKNDLVPVKPILDYLKSIDLAMIAKLASTNYNNLIEDLDHVILNKNNVNNKFDSSSGNIISLKEIAEKYNIPIESVLQIIREEEEKNSNYKNQYIIADMYLIPMIRVKQIDLLLRNTTKYTDACLILAKNHIPEACYNDLISKMGYDLIWHSIDSNTATITKRP